VHEVQGEHSNTHSRLPVYIDLQHLCQQCRHIIPPLKVLHNCLKEDEILKTIQPEIEGYHADVQPVERGGLLIPFFDSFIAHLVHVFDADDTHGRQGEGRVDQNQF